jgi:hypothetical protein
MEGARVLSKKVKRIKYLPSPERIDVEIALGQACQALDVAAYKAVESDDKSALVMVARAWMDMAHLMLGPQCNHSEEEGNDVASIEMGFS